MAQEYACQGKKERGVIRAYLSKMTGLSMAQTARLIQKYRETGVVEPKPSRRYEFSRMHTDADIARLAELDRAHEPLMAGERDRFARLQKVSDLFRFSMCTCIQPQNAYSPPSLLSVSSCIGKF